MRTGAVLLALSLLTSCLPPQDIFGRFVGAYVRVDDIGMTGDGVTVHVEDSRRVVTHWFYAEDGTVSAESLECPDFQLIDLYSENYGTFSPTWIYSYGSKDSAYPRFFILEYFDGRLEPTYLAENPRPDLDLPAWRALSFVRNRSFISVDEIPPVLDFSPGTIPTDYEEARALAGRHFRFVSPLNLDHMSRSVTSAYYPFADGLFGSDYFIDVAVYHTVEVDGWTVQAQVRSIARGDANEDSEPDANPPSFPLFVRLREVRANPDLGPRGLVMVFDYPDQF